MPEIGGGQRAPMLGHAFRLIADSRENGKQAKRG
jgi:hypothetical protein